MSINSLLLLGRRALSNTEAAIQVAGHNVANAGTPGFHRTRLSFSPDSYATSGLWSRPNSAAPFATGASVQGYERVRDALLEQAAWDARGGLGASGEEVRLGYALESLLGLDADTGLGASFTDFWSAWSTAADNPTDVAGRQALLGAASSLTGALNDRAAALTQFETDTRGELTASVDEVNGILDRIAALNTTVRNANAAGAPDLGAEDERDALVASLSEYLPTDVRVAGDGTYTVSVQGMALVQGEQANGLTWSGPPDAAADGLYFEGTTVAFNPGSDGTGGRIGATLRTLTEAIPEARSGLDGLAARLVADVNALHETGYGLDGGTGRAFFDPAGVTAATIALSADVSDPDAIALAGGPDAPGDASVGLAIADLASGFDEDLAALTSSVGERVSRADAMASASSALVAHLDGLAAGVSGVSIDEEMTRLIEYQQAYAAAARVIETAQAMVDTLLAI